MLVPWQTPYGQPKVAATDVGLLYIYVQVNEVHEGTRSRWMGELRAIYNVAF